MSLPLCKGTAYRVTAYQGTEAASTVRQHQGRNRRVVEF